MSARIFRRPKSAMQSGLARTGQWLLEFESDSPRRIEPLMGYTASSDPRRQVRLEFPTLEAARAYCDKHGIEASVEPVQEVRRRRASYSENFAFDRKTPWTH